MGLLDLAARLSLNTTNYEAGLNRSVKNAEKFGTNIGQQLSKRISSAFGAGALIAGAERTLSAVLERVGNIKDASEQLGISTDDVQRLEIAAAGAGLQLQDFAGALDKMGAARRSAAEGNEELRATFARFGVSLTDLQNPLLRDLDLLRKVGAAGAEIQTARGRQEFRALVGPRGARVAGALGGLDNTNLAAFGITEADIKRIDAAKKLRDQAVLFGKAAAAEQVAAPLSGALLKLGPAGLAASLLGRLTGLGTQAPTGAGTTGAGTDTQPLFDDPLARRRETEIARAQNALYESALKLEFQRLDVAEQILSVKRDIANLEVAASEYNAEDAESARLLAQANEKRLQLQTLEDKRPPETAAARLASLTPESNSLRAVGNFLGGDPNAGVTNELKLIKDKLSNIERNTKDNRASVRF